MYHIEEEVVYMGVDIAKAYLDVAIGNEKRRFDNDALGHRQLINWIEQMPASVQVICEPSGGYERALVRALVDCAAENQFGPGQPSPAICPSGGYFGQDRSH
jgi:hypothetical protein